MNISMFGTGIDTQQGGANDYEKPEQQPSTYKGAKPWEIRAAKKAKINTKSKNMKSKNKKTRKRSTNNRKQRFN